MNFGFDIDGTISADVSSYRTLMESLIKNDQEVHVITGTADSVITDEIMDRRIHWLNKNNIPYTHLKVCVGGPIKVAQEKAEYCRDNNICMMFEDSIEYADKISKFSTTLLMVNE
jgi:uncharacterized HAD superfamily protein